MGGDVAGGRCYDVIGINTRECRLSLAMAGFTLSRTYRDAGRVMYDIAFERPDGSLSMSG